MNHTYRWIPTGEHFKCQCGGMVIAYRVTPTRSPTYLNHVMVCNNERCEQAVVHEGTDRERRGRLIIA
jgi:hypothetical protein